jgi:hypothetical protein
LTADDAGRRAPDDAGDPEEAATDDRESTDDGERPSSMTRR